MIQYGRLKGVKARYEQPALKDGFRADFCRKPHDQEVP